MHDWMLEAMEAPIPVHTAVLLSAGFGVAVRKKMQHVYYS